MDREQQLKKKKKKWGKKGEEEKSEKKIHAHAISRFRGYRQAAAFEVAEPVPSVARYLHTWRAGVVDEAQEGRL